MLNRWSPQVLSGCGLLWLSRTEKKFLSWRIRHQRIWMPSPSIWMASSTIKHNIWAWRMDTKCSNFWERTLNRFFRNDLLGLFGANSNLSEVFYANNITILAVLDIKGVVGVMCEFEIFVCKSRSFNDLVILVVFARLWRLNWFKRECKVKAVIFRCQKE